MPPTHRVVPGRDVRLADVPTCVPAEDGTDLEALRERLTDLGDRFAAEASNALLICLQGFDGAGKDEVITHVLSAIDPSILHVFSFNKPVGSEVRHDVLWRFHHQAPERGAVHVFDRSYYEEVVSARVHDLVDDEQAASRCASIIDFERILHREGTIVVKLLLHVSPEVQAERVRERLEHRRKQHEFSAADLNDRELWDDYQRAYETALEATSTDHAPWHVVAADDRLGARTAVAQLLVGLLDELDPQYPPLDEEELEEAGLSG